MMKVVILIQRWTWLYARRAVRIGVVLAVALGFCPIAHSQDATPSQEPYPVDLERDVGPWHVRCFRLPRPPRRSDTDCIVSQVGSPVHPRQPEDARLVFEIRMRPGGGECSARVCEDIILRAAGGGMDMRHAHLVMATGTVMPLRRCTQDRCVLRDGVIPIDPYLDRTLGAIRVRAPAADYMLVSVRATSGIRFVYRFDLALYDEARRTTSDPQREISRWWRLPPID